MYLGFGDVESYGLSWRTEGSGGHITNSVIAHLYFGLYSFDVGGLTISDNEVRDNVLYGIDPHTGSHNLTIERNIVHDNGKHGIILAENCVGQRDPRQRGLPQPAPRDRALPALRPEPGRGQRDVRQRRAGHQHQRGVEQHDQVEPGLRQHRVRHRGRPDRQGQRRAGQRRPRQPAGRAAAGQRGHARPTCGTT